MKQKDYKASTNTTTETTDNDDGYPVFAGQFYDDTKYVEKYGLQRSAKIHRWLDRFFANRVVQVVLFAILFGLLGVMVYYAPLVV